MGKAVIASVVVGTIVLIIGVVLGWAVFPGMVVTQIGENVELKNDTDQFERFEELPLPFDFKVYVFTITNRQDANNGAKPIMREMGPFVYRQTRKKVDITFPDNDLISYYEEMNFEFNAEASNVTDETIVTVLNPALNGAIQILETSNLGLLNDNKVTELVFGQTDIYIEITVKKFLFDGYKICELTKIKDAMATDPTTAIKAQLACIALLIAPAKNLRAENDHIVFTFLNHKNITNDGHYTINNGIKDKSELAVIKKWQDKDFLEFWGASDSVCNEIKGRDAVIFPPFIKEDTVLTVFNTDICRTIDLQYARQVHFRDVNAYEYVLTENTLSAPTAEFGNECYCLNVTNVPEMTQSNGCVKKGLMELFTCYQAPILLSFPHFLWADDSYKNSVDGLKAEEDKHRTYVQLEPNTGTPLTGSKRVQFNMFVKNVTGIDFLANYTEPRLIPIIWLDEHVDITDDLYQVLYSQYVEKTIIIDGVKWGLIAVGIFVVVVTIGISIFKNKRAKKQFV